MFLYCHNEICNHVQIRKIHKLCKILIFILSPGVSGSILNEMVGKRTYIKVQRSPGIMKKET